MLTTVIPCRRSLYRKRLYKKKTISYFNTNKKLDLNKTVVDLLLIQEASVDLLICLHESGDSVIGYLHSYGFG